MKQLRTAMSLTVVGLTLTLAAPAGAPAAEVIGQTGGGALCMDNRAYVQTVLSGGAPYSPSAYGVITSWSAIGGMVAGRMLGLLVLRPNPAAGANHFIATQKDPAHTLVTDQLNTFAVRLPIEPSDRLGNFVPPGQPGGFSNCALVTPAGNNLGSAMGEPPLSVSVDYPDAFSARRLNTSAVVEPDTDRDVFGDESQDNCIGTVGTVGGCPNTVTGASATVKGNKVLVTVTAPGAGTLKAGSTTDPTLLATAAKKKKAQPPLKQSSQTLTAKTKQTVTLTLSLSKSGKGKLARKGKLGVTIKVLYTPTGGTAGAVTTTAKLGKKKKKKR